MSAFRVSVRNFISAGLIISGTVPVSQAQNLTVLNFTKGEAIDYPLAFIYGQTETNATEVKVDGIPFPVRQKHFKALARLKPGNNLVSFDFGEAKETFGIAYVPKNTAKYMRLAYFFGSDEDGSFEAPAGMPNNVKEAVAKIKFAGLLMQTFYAESGKRTIEAVKGGAVVPKRTFRLEMDAEGEPIVHVVKSKSKTGAQWRAIASSSAYGQAESEIRQTIGGGGTYKLGVLYGFSNRQHYVDQTASGQGVAWGGGSLNGSGDGGTTACTLYSWANGLENLVAAMTNKKVPEAGLCRDWNSGTYMGNYGTTLGGWFHELGHTFGMGHTAYGIMSSQIDQSYRFFMIEDVSRSNQYLTPANELDNTWWHSSEVNVWEGDFFVPMPAVGIAARRYAAEGRLRPKLGRYGWTWDARGYAADGRKLSGSLSRPIVTAK